MLYLSAGDDVAAGAEADWGSTWFLTMVLVVKNMSPVYGDQPRVTL